MSFTITGRILGLTESKSNKLEVNVGDNESSQPLAKPIHTDRDGRFELTLDKPPSGRVTLKVTDQLGQITEVDLENVSDTGEVIVVLPEISEDPRDHVEHVAKTIVAEREAVASAKKVLAKEIKTRIVDEEAIDEVVNDVLTQLADHSGGDLQWKVRGKETIQTLTKKAVSEARTVLDDRSPVVVARQNALVDGEQMSTRELITRLTGGRTHRDGFWRVDP
jgi:hypothetical protein